MLDLDLSLFNFPFFLDESVNPLLKVSNLESFDLGEDNESLSTPMLESEKLADISEDESDLMFIFGLTVLRSSSSDEESSSSSLTSLILSMLGFCLSAD